MTVLDTPAATGRPARRGPSSYSGWDELQGPARHLVHRAERTLDVPADRSALRRCLGKPLTHPMAQPAHRIVAACLEFLPDPDDSRIDRRTLVDIAAVERAFYTVAALIAAQPRTARDSHLAQTASERPDAVAPAEPRAEAAGATTTTAGGQVSVAAPSPPDTAAGPAPRAARGVNLGRCLAQAINRRPGAERAAVYRRWESRLRLLCRQDLDGVHRHLPPLIRQLRADEVTIDWVRLTVDLARWGLYPDQVAKAWLQQFYRTARLTGGPSDSPDLDTSDDTEGETS
ncbi:type I-E CRISPR-associated protein Cse2/CasB [Parafrankia sp. EUN1f]|uniref:type I-E CRISPR-associated protein Cse2/CasB n=1 Tax=Parafrankia sp. EUN1f TaxID=102897 RepID=UPI0001C462FC|nr:type I-E CRISPR-associated protein Cse2/CasB [Parafrankia sp. EUN1f]EFC82262.1 CRISPR-associated protein, Cse2 family [Parafrankia sp. EUN1f]